MEIYIEKIDKKMNIDFNGTCEGLLLRLNINPDEVLVLKNNICVPIEIKIDNEDNIRILSVISGG